jgi:hypothetical protein
MVRRVGKERVLVWRAQEQADGKDHDPYPFLSEGAEEGNGTEG